MKLKETSHVVYFRKSKMKSSEDVRIFLEGWIGEMMGSGSKTQQHGSLILTNERVVFCRKGFFGEVFQTIPIDKITSIETRSFLGYRVIAFHTSHDELTFKTFEGADLFVKLHEEVERLRTEKKPSSAPLQTSPLLALEKLAELRSKGIISESEFADKKAELLRQI